MWFFYLLLVIIVIAGLAYFWQNLRLEITTRRNFSDKTKESFQSYKRSHRLNVL